MYTNFFYSFVKHKYASLYPMLKGMGAMNKIEHAKKEFDKGVQAKQVYRAIKGVG